MFSIGMAVKHIRARLGKTQLEFATMFGCRENTVRRWEHDEFKPRGIALIQLIDLAEGEEKEPLALELALDIGPRRVDLTDGTWREIPGSAGPLAGSVAGQKLTAFLRDRSSALEPAEQLERSVWHAVLDQILDSGQPDAVNMIQHALLIAEDRVRLKAEKARKSKR
jgi:transcriptional regulator with XRE-family HTH domain